MVHERLCIRAHRRYGMSLCCWERQLEHITSGIRLCAVRVALKIFLASSVWTLLQSGSAAQLTGRSLRLVMLHQPQSPENLPSDQVCLLQGAFILVGSSTIGVPLLVLLAVALLTYCTWRFWEGCTGQGSDNANGNMRNFFRYRLSPVVSGIVYLAYTAFVITLIPKTKTARANAASNQSFPDSWTHSSIGKTGLCLAGIAFMAGE